MRHRCVSVALHRQDNEKAANQEWRFANMVYPEFSPTASLRAASNETHNGVWAIPESLAQRYCEFLDPVILRRSVATQTANASSICNFGKAKGRTYDHVLIYPVADMASWLQDASTDLKPQTRSKLYVATTNGVPSTCGFAVEYPNLSQARRRRRGRPARRWGGCNAVPTRRGGRGPSASL